MEEDGQNVTFTLVNEEPFTYTVNASSSTGNHQFSGVLLNADRMTIDVGGDTSLSVERTGAPPAPLLPPPPPVEASTARSLSQATVDGGAPVVVTVIPAGLGGFGSLAETLPAGFSYVSSSLRDNRVEEDGQTVTFTLLNEDPFTYTVTASGVDGLYTFTGVLTDGDKVTHDIPDSIIRVGPEPTPVTPEASTTRSLSQTMVDGGATVVITIIPAGLGGFGSLVETLPAGFSYDSSNLSDNRVEEDGQTVTFTLLNEDPFTYTVTASSVDGLYTFTGVLTDGDKVAHNIADSTIRVGPEPTPVTSEPTPVKPEATPEPTPTRRISTSIRRSSGGVAIIIPAAPTPTLEPTPAPTPTPAPATPNPTAEIIMVKGLEGERGEPGPEGERGEPGLPGRMGETGEQGPAGQLGVTGATGVGGSFGPAGSEGQDGLPGAEGAPGPKGPDGPEGPAGEPGSAGNDGVTGPPGSKVSILYIAALIISIVALAASAGRLLDLYMEKKAKNNLP